MLPSPLTTLYLTSIVILGHTSALATSCSLALGLCAAGHYTVPPTRNCCDPTERPLLPCFPSYRQGAGLMISLTPAVWQKRPLQQIYIPGTQTGWVHPHHQQTFALGAGTGVCCLHIIIRLVDLLWVPAGIPEMRALFSPRLMPVSPRSPHSLLDIRRLWGPEVDSSRRAGPLQSCGKTRAGRRLAQPGSLFPSFRPGAP